MRRFTANSIVLVLLSTTAITIQAFGQSAKARYERMREQAVYIPSSNSNDLSFTSLKEGKSEDCYRISTAVDAGGKRPIVIDDYKCEKPE